MKMKKRMLSLTLVLILCLGLTIPAAAASAEAVQAADRLYELGLFKGVGTNSDGTPNYDLDRDLNRAEAIALLVRLLGKETEAQLGTWENPFTDVDGWAKPYVGFAYANGLANGTSATTFGGAATVSATQYLTLVLRALGYKDAIDFEWDKAWKLTDELGITSGEYKETSAFTRGDAVLVSSNALDIKLKDGSKTLLEVIEENLASVPSGKTFTCTGETWPREGSSFSYQPDGAKATVEVIAADEAVFTLEYPFPKTEAQNFVVSFAKRTQKSPLISEIHIFSFEYYREDNQYSASGGYSTTDFETWTIGGWDEDMSGVAFTDTNAQDYKVTWRVKLPAGCPFSFDMVGEYVMECAVGVFLGGGE